MTARELYDTDPGFRGFLACWDEDRRCPLELVDYLLDRGMDSQAEAARWAHEGDDWELFSSAHPNSCKARHGRYPACFSDGDWMWRCHETQSSFYSNRSHWCDGHGLSGEIEGLTAHEAIIALLDAWKAPVPA